MNREHHLTGRGGQPSPAPSVGRVLTLLRVHRGLTQRQLAEESGVSRTMLSDFERGRRSPGPETLDRLLRGMGLPERAWDDTVRHVAWLDWLTERESFSQRRGDANTAPASASDREIALERVAETACRDLERHVVDVMRLVIGSGSRGLE